MKILIAALLVSTFFYCQSCQESSYLSIHRTKGSWKIVDPRFPKDTLFKSFPSCLNYIDSMGYEVVHVMNYSERQVIQIKQKRKPYQ